MNSGDAICLISLPYLIMCGIFYHFLDKTTQKIIEEGGLHEEDENQLQWMVSAAALPIFLSAPILYFSGMQDQFIHWLVWGKLEARNFKNEPTKGG